VATQPPDQAPPTSASVLPSTGHAKASAEASSSALVASSDPRTLGLDTTLHHVTLQSS
jgi:hypothetical protein